MTKLKIVKILCWISVFAVLLSWFVVMLGAYTRLTNSGLGCPDWPGCYGHLVVSNQSAIEPGDSIKAWTEMIHRYVAGSLVLLIVCLSLGVRYVRRCNIKIPYTIPLFLLFLLTFQAALGMWTVTLKLLPIVVMGHLLGGFLVFVSLVYYSWQMNVPSFRTQEYHRIWPINLALLIVFCQIALGGWVSANYAGVACIGFPLCNGQWLPELSLDKAFQFWSQLGVNYQGGILENNVRVTIQVVHRMWAYVTFAYIFTMFLCIFASTKVRIIRNLLIAIALALFAQFTLGIINVVYLLPLWNAVAHNGIAALLLALLASLRYVLIKHRGEICK